MKAIINGDELDLNKVDLAVGVEQDMVDVTPGIEVRPDMGWEYTDRNGHYHAFALGETPLPTLEHHEIETTEMGNQESTYLAWWACRICNERVEVKWIEQRATHRVYAPGRLAWRADLRASGEEAERIRRLDGESVSIRVIEAQEAKFGLGLLRITGMAGRSYENDSIRLFASIYGTSALGTRKVV